MGSNSVLISVSCLTLDKLFYLSELQILQLREGDNNNISIVWGDFCENELNTVHPAHTISTADVCDYDYYPQCMMGTQVW